VHTAATLLLLLLALCAVMVLGWAFQRHRNNGGWTDVFWTFGTGAVCVAAALALPGEPARQLVVAVLAAVWSLRLGFHILARVLGSDEEDRRYANFREDWGADFQRRMFSFLQTQALAGFVLAAAVFVAAHNPAPFGSLLDYAALALFALALAGESLADAQLAQFKADPANRGRVADTGLWAWSRHPNYFFEWLVWVAVALLAIAPGYPQGWWALAAPVLMFVLLNYVSGVPPLELAMRQSRGAAFDAYAARTSRFFPMPPRAPRQPQR
jgi:steroid 5-alpha reductase family enzyme